MKKVDPFFMQDLGFQLRNLHLLLGGNRLNILSC